MAHLVPEPRPIIDFSNDDDVKQPGYMNDAALIGKGWGDAKVAAYDAFRRTSDAYNHFDITLTRIPATSVCNAYFEYKYICKAGHPRCEHKQRREQKATNKILKKANDCNKKNASAAPQPKQKDLHSTTTTYDKIHHRMLIAMRCAVHNRPFLSVEDNYYKLEIEHLRAGTPFPNRKQVSTDIKTLHEFASHELKGLIGVRTIQVRSWIVHYLILKSDHSRKVTTRFTLSLMIGQAKVELGTGLDLARNDQALDPVVRLGANWAIFILGKYYAKLDDCEIYPIALVLDPRKTAKWIKKNKGWQSEWKTAALEKVQHCWNESYKPTTQARATSPVSACPSESQYTNPYLNGRAGSIAGDESSDDENDEDEYARFCRIQRPASVLECPNPIKWWLGRQSEYPNLSRMALDYLIIPSTSVDAERAFSQCTLVLGKLRTQLSDETFRASLLLRSWDLAGVLPGPGQLTQCLRDSEEKKRKAELVAKSNATKSNVAKRRRSFSNTSSNATGPSYKRANVISISDCDE